MSDNVPYWQDTHDEKLINTCAEINTIECHILPGLEVQLQWLTHPDYDPAENDDHEYQDKDILFTLYTVGPTSTGKGANLRVFD